MKYRNIKTGVVVDITSKVKIGEWVAVEPSTAKEVKPTKTPRKRKTKDE